MARVPSRRHPTGKSARRCATLRIFSGLEQGERPGPASSIAELHYSGLDTGVKEKIVDSLGS
jgi:hypothetical protein